MLKQFASTSRENEMLRLTDLIGKTLIAVERPTAGSMTFIFAGGFVAEVSRGPVFLNVYQDKNLDTPDAGLQNTTVPLTEAERSGVADGSLRQIVRDGRTIFLIDCEPPDGDSFTLLSGGQKT